MADSNPGDSFSDDSFSDDSFPSDSFPTDSFPTDSSTTDSRSTTTHDTHKPSPSSTQHDSHTTSRAQETKSVTSSNTHKSTSTSPHSTLSKVVTSSTSKVSSTTTTSPPRATTTAPPPPPPTPPPNNTHTGKPPGFQIKSLTPLFIGLGVLLVLIVAGLAFWYWRRQKKGSKVTKEEIKHMGQEVQQYSHDQPQYVAYAKKFGMPLGEQVGKKIGEDGKEEWDEGRMHEQEGQPGESSRGLDDPYGGEPGQDWHGDTSRAMGIEPDGESWHRGDDPGDVHGDYGPPDPGSYGEYGQRPPSELPAQTEWRPGQPQRQDSREGGSEWGDDQPGGAGARESYYEMPEPAAYHHGDRWKSGRDGDRLL